MDILRRQRGTIKAKLTRLERKVEDERDQNQDTQARERVEVYTSRLEEIRSEFEDVQRRIIATQMDEAHDTEDTEDEEFEDRYLRLKILLKQMARNVPIESNEERASQVDDRLMRVIQQQSEIIQKISINGAGETQASASNDAIARLVTQQTELLRRFTEGSGTAGNNESKVRLPVIKLPTFDGRTEEWKRFSETFQSLIHNNDSIPKVQKFQYLTTSLIGAAAKIIESIELTGDNYSVAWNLLTKRYDDPRAIKKKHIQCLFTMPRVDRESSSAIRGLVDYTLKHLRILKSMDLPTDSWHELIVHMMEAKLDTTTLRAWEQNGNPAVGTLDNMIDFLQARCQMLERIEARSKQKDVAKETDKVTKSRNQNKSLHGDKALALAASTNAGKCYLCQGDHFLYSCDQFLKMTVDERLKEVQRLKLCINCLRNDHFIKTCRMGTCKECTRRHNTLLHRSTLNKEHARKEEVTEAASTNTKDDTSNNLTTHHAAKQQRKQQVFMATAIVDAVRSNGSNVTIRILLDSASEANFVTQAACNRLGVKRDQATETVTGLNAMESPIRQCCNIMVNSRHSSYRANVHCLVVPTITKNLPSAQIDRNTIPIPTNMKLADHAFHRPGPIDMLLGAEFFFDLLTAEKIELGDKCPVLLNTRLGWIIAGSIPLAEKTSLICNRSTITALNCSLDYHDTLKKSLERFWEIENIQSESNKPMSDDDRRCEEYFDKTTVQDENGRFIVRLPFREDPSRLGKSRDIAIKRLIHLERRFTRDENLQEQYINFMREYQQLGHMSPVDETAQDDQRTIVYLPHHCVLKETSSSTKLRTVFDASSKTDSGISLNDVLHVGPTLQGSLFEIVVRFRFHRIALTGDLRKMYRQVLLHPDDRDYQRIVWRESSSESIRDFQLDTVTYGEASSSYLAIKCVQRLAELGKDEYPVAARVILDEMYVDDIMTGADNIQDAIELQRQLSALLEAGGFEIHKWCSNHFEALAHLPIEQREDIATHSINANDIIKTLGLEWYPKGDTFQFSVKQVGAAVTKRQVLSAISKVFDPLGLIGPILTTAKRLMQETWRIDREWDEPLPSTFIDRWERFRQDLNSVETLSIPRCVIPCKGLRRIFLQGFCDASEQAYGACLYIQVEDKDGALTSRLLCSKSRVAPVKAITIPRLELCSAVSLARLIASVLKSLRVQVDGIQAWSDSTVAICWIQGDVSRWKQFVSNRVSEIIQILPKEQWHHVSGKDNPADLISRGTSAQHLKNSDLWWFGPQWLREEVPVLREESKFEISNESVEIVKAEERKLATNLNIVRGKPSVIQEILEKFSSLTKIERVLAYIVRFISNISRKRVERVVGRLSTIELQGAHRRLIKHVQDTHFAKESAMLQPDHKPALDSKLNQLHPFLDKHGLIRVGGRLQHTSWSFERKHPIVLPAGNRFTRLLFEREHIRLMHASQLLLLSVVRERYWPLRGRDTARQVCHSCVWCTRNKPQDLSQIMGSLPSDRVQPTRPFTITGVDFAGPITTLVSKGRGRKTNKSYIALFICFTTKAIHLEATSELTTASFIAALRRFVGRRGRPRTLYSDNGTNFVGANRELKEVHRFVRASVEADVGDMLANENIEWKFIPPGSPNMGGLWEAGVKSCKYFLRRVMGNTFFTFEELSTVLSQIEACLNSRPLSAISNDPTDLQPLTPAHFLVGETLTSLPDVDVTEVPMNRLSRWQAIQRMLQDFWKRWAAEYLSNMQGRSKWRVAQENLKIGDLVIVRGENLPPLRWRLGRVVELHPGSDEIVRVVTIRTCNGNTKRSISKLCKLPIASDSEI